MHHGLIAQGKQDTAMDDAIEAAEIHIRREIRRGHLMVIVKPDIQSPRVVITADIAVSGL
jgi:hypothetical protein